MTALAHILVTDMIGPTVHHVDRRQSCAGCGTRVFTYADVLDDTSGAVLLHLCAAAHGSHAESRCAGCVVS